MKCHHCQIEFFPENEIIDLGRDSDGPKGICKQLCPSCGKLNLFLLFGKRKDRPKLYTGEINKSETILLYPIPITQISRIFDIPANIPADLLVDYQEACLVLSVSPKASAALSRRCLQNILRQKANVKPSSLANEIFEIQKSNVYSKELLDSLNAVKNFGNFSAHPNKNQNTGEIIPIELEEAEWCLDIIERLFIFYFVEQEKSIKMIAKANEKYAQLKLKS